MTVFCENYTRYINVFCLHNSEALNVKWGVEHKLSLCTEKVKHCGNCIYKLSVVTLKVNIVYIIQRIWKITSTKSDHRPNTIFTGFFVVKMVSPTGRNGICNRLKHRSKHICATISCNITKFCILFADFINVYCAVLTEHRLFPQTALTDWFDRWRRSSLCVRIEPTFCINYMNMNSTLKVTNAVIILKLFNCPSFSHWHPWTFRV
jgi:hypothetical protein